MRWYKSHPSSTSWFAASQSRRPSLCATSPRMRRQSLSSTLHPSEASLWRTTKRTRKCTLITVREASKSWPALATSLAHKSPGKSSRSRTGSPSSLQSSSPSSQRSMSLARSKATYTRTLRTSALTMRSSGTSTSTSWTKKAKLYGLVLTGSTLTISCQT